MELFSIHDKKAGYFAPPFVAENSAMSIRMASSLVNNPGAGDICQYPEDFSIIKLGSFNPETGVIKPEDHVHVSGCLELKKEV